MQKRLGLTLFAGLAIIVAACGSNGASTAPSAGDLRPLKVGVVTDVGQLEDKSFNQSSYEGAEAAAAAIGGEHDVIVTQSISDYEQNIQTFVDQGFNVIVTVGFLIGTDTAAAAKANPNVKFIGVDQGICVDETVLATRPSPARAMRPRCCRTTRASCSPKSSPATWPASLPPASPRAAPSAPSAAPTSRRSSTTARGYENGAKSVNPDIKVLYQETNPDPAKGFNDPAKGKAIAEQFIGQGADVLFQIAGLTGQGALEAACDADVYGIGVDVDQAVTLPEPCDVHRHQRREEAHRHRHRPSS